MATGIRTGAGAAAALAFPSLHVLSPDIRAGRQLVGLADRPFGATLDPAGVRALALRAVDAARSAGAQYADVRLTRTITQQFVTGSGSFALLTGEHHDNAPTDMEVLGFGVRAFAEGCWGFAASPIWTIEEAILLASNAVEQARANALASPRQSELVPTPVVSGHWQPPTVIDPFLIPPEEKLDCIRSLADYAMQHKWMRERHNKKERSIGGNVGFIFTRQERALATSEGSYCTQQLYTATGGIGVGTLTTWVDEGGGSSAWFGPNGLGENNTGYPNLVSQGWEYCDIPHAKQRIDSTVEMLKRRPENATDRHKPVDVGQYDVVLTAAVSAQLVGKTIGEPTELDRALGYEANAGGTSYLNDPLAMAGTFQIASPLLNVSANRSVPTHLATVQWDDEGVVPEDFSIVRDGVLTDFQTTRESAAWLGAAAKHGRSPRSHGCASAESALNTPMTHTPNLMVRPSKDAVLFDTLVQDTQKGVVITRAGVTTDFQGKTGLCIGEMREIVNGRVGAILDGATMHFSTATLWKSLIAIGGTASASASAHVSQKGEPSQTTYYTVSSVPMKIAKAAIVRAT